MKKTIALFLFILCLQLAKAQTYVTIPDANFVTWLQANVPFAMSGNQMDITAPSVVNRTGISLYNLNIVDLTGIQYFNSLDTFQCILNPITSLPVLSNSVTRINLFGNQLTTLPTLPSSLNYLRCQQNQLTGLPSLPNSLTQLFCGDNQLTSLPSLPNLITTIEFQNNALTNLPILPTSLIYFSCAFNQLTSLPSLPNSIYFLNCSNNNLNNLPTLSSSLDELICNNNQLTNLPSLPNSLTRLYCLYNQLSNLPTLPGSLLILDCSHNLLTNLPVLPIALSELNCSHNQLTSLPFLPIGLDALICSYNMISCFPVLPNIPAHYIIGPTAPTLAFEIIPNSFTCLPNYVGGMDTVTLNYPLCVSGNTITNPNGCITGKGITGTTFHDFNLDCVKNISELGYANAIVKLHDNSNQFLGITSSGFNGLYNFNVPTGTYHVILDTVNKPFTVLCLNPGIDSLVTIVPTQLVEDSVDFAITCKPGFDVGVQSINKTGAAFPGMTHTLTVFAGDMTHWYNLNCATGISGTVSFSVNGPVTYIGPAAGALTPNVTGNIYSYTIADFGLVNNLTDFKLIFSTNSNAQAGNMICVNTTVTPISGDNVPSNNISQFCYNVVNSFDPNIKEVYPAEVQTGFNDWLTYTIHFQNTGNAPAINIRLEDQLDAKLNPETFELINYSHYNIINVTGNHLTVRFPNIQLADSTSNPQGSIGFVQYRIKPKANWINDTIRNSADIYFDYNAPVVTNTTKSYFMTITGVRDISNELGVISLIPNPTNNLLSITSKNEFNKIELLNITGQVLLSESVNSKTHQLQLQNFAEGIYFVKIAYPNEQSITKKIIKQ